VEALSYGKIFELRTYHSGLKYLFGQPTLNVRQIRWLEFLSEYDFEIKHIKGKENKVVDALSKRVHEMHATTISMYKSDLKDRILEVAKLDQHYLQTKETLQQGNFQQKIKDYELREDGILMYRGKVYVPKSQELKSIVLREMHNVSYVGHPGYQKTIAVVNSQYFWSCMKIEVVDYIVICLECQMVKDGHKHPARIFIAIAHS
jgi:hypothetical protein